MEQLDGGELLIKKAVFFVIKGGMTGIAVAIVNGEGAIINIPAYTQYRQRWIYQSMVCVKCTT